ncbi:hypothetical protein HKD37_20G055764 [Glycine soja]
MFEPFTPASKAFRSFFKFWILVAVIPPFCVLPIEPKNHFLQFSHWNAQRSTDKRWEALWIALSMTIWKHRNSMVFNNQLFIPEKVMDETLFHTWSWLRCMEKDFNTHFNHWLSNLSVSHCLCYMLYTSVHLKTKRGTSNNLKVVHSGTKEFKIASNKRDLFLGFSEHQERLRKKLALEEGRIFAANEQLY